jgi:hypothetical protein
MGSLEELVLQAFRQHAERSGMVRGKYSDLLGWLGSAGEGLNENRVHGSLNKLNQGGHFRQPDFDSDPKGGFFLVLAEWC